LSGGAITALPRPTGLILGRGGERENGRKGRLDKGKGTKGEGNGKERKGRREGMNFVQLSFFLRRNPALSS